MYGYCDTHYILWFHANIIASAQMVTALDGSLVEELIVGIIDGLIVGVRVA